MTIDTVRSLSAFAVEAPQVKPYLGPLAPGEAPNARGYVVRKGNGTIYPMTLRSVVVKIETHDGRVGWGETYGLVAPKVISELVRDVIAPVVTGRSPLDVEVIWEDLYDLMRVRGYTGGFLLDALAAVDIGLWDLKGKLLGQPLSALLGRRRSVVPVYASGLPGGSLAERVDIAERLIGEGHGAVKFAAVASHEGVENEMAALRARLPETTILADLHWKYSAPEAVAVIRRMEAYGLGFAEAPCKPEDVEGLAWVARQVGVPIAAGEEWRSVYDAVPRVAARAIGILQPEMGHTGITQFVRMVRLAEAHHLRVAPHATIGAGIFLAASIHAAAATKSLLFHEHQHSLFDAVQAMTHGLTFDQGYCVPNTPGLGVEPSERFWTAAEPI